MKPKYAIALIVFGMPFILLFSPLILLGIFAFLLGKHIKNVNEEKEFDKGTIHVHATHDLPGKVQNIRYERHETFTLLKYSGEKPVPNRSMFHRAAPGVALNRGYAKQQRVNMKSDDLRRMVLERSFSSQ